MIQIKRKTYADVVVRCIAELEQASTTMNIDPNLLPDLQHLLRKLNIAEDFSPTRAVKPGAAAKYLGVSRRFVTELGAKGVIPRIRLSSKVVNFDLADLDRLIDERKELNYGGAR